MKPVTKNGLCRTVGVGVMRFVTDTSTVTEMFWLFLPLMIFPVDYSVNDYLGAYFFDGKVGRKRLTSALIQPIPRRMEGANPLVLLH